MADSSVPISAGTGTSIDTRTAASNGDHRQVVVLGNDGDNVVGVEPFGALTVNPGFSTLFYDSYSAALDTTDKWTITGSAPVTNGQLAFPATASTYNAIRTKDTIRPNAGHTYVANGITLEASAAVGAGRFWGLGTTATTPAPGVLVQDGVGFEVDQATGSLLAVTYSNGVRTTIATLTRPTDGNTHRYALYFRVTSVSWFVDNLQVPVASQSFPNVTLVELPALLVRQNAAAFTGTPVFLSIAHLTADTSSQGRSLADPVIGTRMARVTPNSALAVTVRGTTETTGVASGNIFVARAAITTATTTLLQAAPATGLSLYVTDVSVSNSGATLSTASLLPTGGSAFVDIVAAATGGGGSMNFQTPVKLAAATGLSVTTSAASTTVYVTVTGYTAA